MKSDLYLFMHNESNSDSLENWENTNCPEYPNLDYNLLYASKSMTMVWFNSVPWCIGLKCLRVVSKKTIYEVSSVNYL